MNLEPLYTFSYRIFGPISEKLEEKFFDFSEIIRKALLGVGPSSYISLMLLVGVISSTALFVTVLLSSIFLLHISLLPALLLSVVSIGGAWLLVFALFYSYPLLRIKSMRAELERDLPFIASYMAVMTSAGVSPYEMFKALARGNVIPSITPLAAIIVRDVELLGFDALSAIMRAANLAPSPRLRSLLNGMVATVHTGSDLSSYLRSAMEEALRTQRVRLREMAETLSVFGEAFVSIFVAAPIFITIMLTLMALLGGMGGINPVVILSLIVYVFMPLAGLGMLVVAKVLTPGE
ncbi:hypothetical protein DRO33_01225 [Candidatus Bathyarchaeota archaeon]|nr:MAG: hypothetical protein DRO33_01225 [Candidatus Bathyarchaeota archaeon]